MIELLSDSRLSSIQDAGRAGLMNIGVGRAGAMDPISLRVGNWLVGGEGDEAGMELAQFPLRVRFHHAARFSVTGILAPMHLDGMPVPTWWSRRAQPGQVLSIGAPMLGARGYFCVSGGFDVPEVLGSKSTDSKSGFGGYPGGPMSRGTMLSTLDTGAAATDAAFGVAPKAIAELYASLRNQSLVVGVIPACEFSKLTPSSQQLLESCSWMVGPDSNRIGYRLEGDTLTFSVREELLSHGIVPGVIQVPGSGQPIVQLADANTCGGYPKVGVIIASDLWKLAQLRSGDTLRFSLIATEDAIARQHLLDTDMQTLQHYVTAQFS